MNETCLICNKDISRSWIFSASDRFGKIAQIECQECGKVYLDPEAYKVISGEESDKFKACLYYYIHNIKKDIELIPYVYQEGTEILINENREKFVKVTITEILDLYPKSTQERYFKILQNLRSITSELGDEIKIPYNPEYMKIQLFITKTNEFSMIIFEILNQMKDLDLIDMPRSTLSETVIVIKSKGWEMLETYKEPMAKINAHRQDETKENDEEKIDSGFAKYNSENMKYSEGQSVNGINIGDKNKIKNTAIINGANDNESMQSKQKWVTNHPFLSAIVASLIASAIWGVVTYWDSIKTFIEQIFGG